MFDAFAILQLPRDLALSEDAIRASYRQMGKQQHPDEGGSEEHFAIVSRAYQTLLSPAKRLRHWLELQGINGNSRGVVDGILLDDFQTVAQCLQQTDSILRAHENAQSMLAKALLQPQIQLQREQIEAVQQLLDQRVSEKLSQFPSMLTTSAELAWICVRDLTFLEKWQQQLRERYGKCFA